MSHYEYKKLAINRYGFFETNADTNISADTDISILWNLVFCFIKNVVYFMPYLFSKTSKIRIYELKFLKLQQIKYLIHLLA